MDLSYSVAWWEKLNISNVFNFCVDGEDDPDLLNELSELADDGPPPEAPPRASRPAPPPPGGAGGALVTLLQDRIQMYTQAELNAKTTGETSRLRRYLCYYIIYSFNK